MEDGETEVETAEREILEETAIEVFIEKQKIIILSLKRTKLQKLNG